MGVMAEFSRQGDDFIASWNPDVKSEVENAEKMFKLLQAKGLTAFKTHRTDGVTCEHCGKDTRGPITQGPQLREFDPQACEILWVGNFHGG